MGLFSKKAEKKEMGPNIPSFPSLPELPSLPAQFPDYDGNYEQDEIHELPSFPSNATGDRFSRESIKNAILGDEEEHHISIEEVLPQRELGIAQKPMSGKQINGRMKTRSFEESPRLNGIEKDSGPVFVRLDKFEESLHIFRETREKINEIEKLLEETKSLKEKEEKELSDWENEIQEMKRKIEKVNTDIFSKI